VEEAEEEESFLTGPENSAADKAAKKVRRT